MGGVGDDAFVLDRRSGSDAEGGRREVAVSAPLDDPSREGAGGGGLGYGGVGAMPTYETSDGSPSGGEGGGDEDEGEREYGRTGGGGGATTMPPRCEG
jgi:hypothetical protein